MSSPSAFSRFAVLLYGIACYLIFFATFLYLICFIGGFLVPVSLDSPATGSLGTALLINATLVLLFGLQHSVMARRGFKRWITGFIPEAAERSTFVLAASVALLVLFRFWQPMGGIIWQVQQPLGRGLLLAGFATGWLIVLGSTLFINHFDLFGLRQTWKYFRHLEYRPITFVTPGPYRLVRHPLYVGFLLAFWCAPTMSAAHLVFALLNTAYILTAIRFEERDLAAYHGESYVEYQKRTPMLVPRLSRVSTPKSRIA